MIVLVLVALGEDPTDALRNAFFLHLGTAGAAAYYFRRDLAELFSDLGQARLSRFRRLAALAILISGFVALALLRFLYIGIRYGYAFVGSMLVITGVALELKRFGYKEIDAASAVAAGIAQGLAVLPGLSRSGLTLAALGALGVSGTEALRFSFIISIPAVIAAGILLGSPEIAPGPLVGLACSFVLGLATIDALMRAARRIRRGPLLMFLGALSIVAYIAGVERSLFTRILYNSICSRKNSPRASTTRTSNKTPRRRISRGFARKLRGIASIPCASRPGGLRSPTSF